MLPQNELLHVYQPKKKSILCQERRQKEIVSTPQEERLK